MLSTGLAALLLFSSPVLGRRTRQPSEFQKQPDYDDLVRKLRHRQDQEASAQAAEDLMMKLGSYKKECPRYDPVQVSEWQYDSDDMLTSSVTFPEVDHSTLTTRVDQSGEVIRVTGLREINMPRSCLPASAKLSYDGQSEILEAVVRVPKIGDGKKAEIDTFPNGLQLFVPLKVRCPQYKPTQVSDWDLDSENYLNVRVEVPEVIKSTVSTKIANSGSEIRVSGLRELSPQALSCLPPDARVTKDKRHEILEVVIPVPEDGDGQKAEVETSSGQVQIFLPLKVRCPEYRPVRVSDWKADAKQLTSNIELPDVDKSTLRIALADNEKSIRVRGLRQVPAAGRSCLPKNAKMTKDGRYEIVEVAVPVPKDGDAKKAQSEEIKGGLQLVMPFKRKPCPLYQAGRASAWELDSELQLVADVALPGVEKDTIRVLADKDDSRIHIKAMRDIRKHRRECLPEDANVIANGGYEVLKVVVDVPPGRSAQDVEVDYFDNALRLYLPGEDPRLDSDGHNKEILMNGMVIEDHEYDWPEKDEDASDGYYDQYDVFREWY
jgi:HSP20 family molecular chaperone IbpA